MAARGEGKQQASRFTYCSLPPSPPRRLPADIPGLRLQAILVNASRWVNGTVLRYYFFDLESDGENVVFADGTTEWRPWAGDGSHLNLVREAFQSWKEIGLGLDFIEVHRREEAEVRIGFMRDGRSWSYVGREILRYGPNQRTMNFGWDLVVRDGGPDRDTAMHEIGHTVGLPHEHQNPQAGLTWDEERVYAEMAKQPTPWSREETDFNIIRKIPPDTIQGSSWDPDSIMHYPFEAGLILQPERYRNEPLVPAGGLSPRDLTWVRTFYPPTDQQAMPELKPLNSEPLAVGPELQRDFAIHPTEKRKYRLSTFGEADTVMVLFESIDGDLRFLAGDDDSGEERNASLETMLLSGRKYVLRVRVNYALSKQTAVMMW